MAAASVQAELDTLPFAQPQESSPRAAAPAWQVAPDGTALRPDQANLARQLTWPAPDAPTLARMWRDMVNHYGAQLVGREQGARGGLLPAMLLQSGQDPRRLRGQVDDNPAADAWRFTVRPNGRDAHRLRVVQGDPEPVLGRRRRVRAALRLELVLLDGTVVTVQAEPYALGVRMESCAPDRASADRLRARNRSCKAQSNVRACRCSAGATATRCRKAGRMRGCRRSRRRRCCGCPCSRRWRKWR
jgi:hypothetical protein